MVAQSDNRLMQPVQRVQAIAAAGAAERRAAQA
jgi:hypothetical protein